MTITIARPSPAPRVEFPVGPYRVMFGPSDSTTGFSLWMWNGYYWQIEIAEATDREGAVHAFTFKIAS